MNFCSRKKNGERKSLLLFLQLKLNLEIDFLVEVVDAFFKTMICLCLN